MGLISAAIGSAAGVLSDQWKEYFYCDALPDNVLAVKGKKRNSGHSGNRGSDNIITAGSVIAVADGQCMMIVENGKIVDVCAEPGEFIYDTSTGTDVEAKRFVVKSKQLKGDVNLDGAVNISDVVAIINQMAGTATYINADVNSDGAVNISDVVAVINIMAGK